MIHRRIHSTMRRCSNSSVNFPFLTYSIAIRFKWRLRYHSWCTSPLGTQGVQSKATVAHHSHVLPDNSLPKSHLRMGAWPQSASQVLRHRCRSAQFKARLLVQSRRLAPNAKASGRKGEGKNHLLGRLEGRSGCDVAETELQLVHAAHDILRANIVPKLRVWRSSFAVLAHDHCTVGLNDKHYVAAKFGCAHMGLEAVRQVSVNFYALFGTI